MEVVPKYKGDFVFMIIDEGGLVVYSYPELGDRSRLLSALIHVVSEISSVLSENSKEITLDLGDRRAVVVKKKNFTFVIIYSEELDEHSIREAFDDIVRDVMNILSTDTIFPDDIAPLITAAIVEKLPEIVSNVTIPEEPNENSILIPVVKSHSLIRMLNSLMGDDVCVKLLSKLDGKRTLQEIILSENIRDIDAFRCARKLLERGIVRPVNRKALFAEMTLEYVNLIISLLLHLIDKDALFERIKGMISSPLLTIDREEVKIIAPIIENNAIYSTILMDSSYYRYLKEIWNELKSLLKKLILLSVGLFTIEGAVRMVETINEDLRDRYGMIFNDFLEESEIYETFRTGEKEWRRSILS